MSNARNLKAAATTSQSKKESEDDESHWDNGDNTHVGTGQRKTLHGVIFQMKHLMLILLRARKEKKISDYDLASEIESAGDFDDMVFKYTEKGMANGVNNGNTNETNTPKKTHLFVQLKHSQSGTKLITRLKLLKDENFGLKKYFKSWLKICQHPDFESSGESKEFILSTNWILSKNLQREEVISAVDNFLNPKRGVEKRFGLTVEEPEKMQLHDALNSESDVQQLAQALVDLCVPKTGSNNSPSASLSLEIPILKKYQVALKESVIDTETKKIRDDFRTGESFLPPKVKNVRDIFFRKMYIRMKMMDKKDNEKEVEKYLKTQTLDISDDFDERAEVEQELPDDGNKVTREEISRFLRAFHLVVEQPNERKLGNMMKQEFIKSRNFKLLNNNFILNDFEKNIWDWFKTKTGHFFTHKYVEYFIGKAECELSSLITVGLNLSHLAELKEHYDQSNLGFEQYETNKELQNFLETTKDTKHQILQLISSETTVSTATRLYKVIEKDKKNFGANDSFLFIHWKKLLSPDVKEHVLRAFESPSSHNLLVIDCGSKSVPKGADELSTKLWIEFWNKLGEAQIYSGCTKRLILITGHEDPFVKSEHKILYANGDKLETRPATSILKTVKPIGCFLLIFVAYLIHKLSDQE